ncbi:MAG: hypothetical protein JXN60_02060, partial [Lentisphaerae bacterium]|nr:hypothetical protein [Lentisphaerota bacterium]
MRNNKLQKNGSVVLGVTILLFIALALIAGYLSFSANDARLTRLTIDAERAFIIAEAGLDYGIIKLRDLLLEYQLSGLVDQPALEGMINAIAPPNGIDEYDYITPSGASAFKIQIESPLITGTITNGTSCKGSNGMYQYFTITSGCINTNTGQGAVLKQMVQAVGLFLIRFGVFYEKDLEIVPGAAMNFYGPVHANGDVYLGSDGNTLNFYDRLTSPGDIYHRKKSDNNRYGTVKIKNGAGVQKSTLEGGQYLDSDAANWMTASVERWNGNVLSSA